MIKTLFFTSVLFLLGMVRAFAADAYIIGPDDVLEVKYWQDETDRLSTTAKVGQDGMISLDIIGEIEAAGKTTSQLEREIVRQISRLNPDISQALVRVIEYGYQKVYVSGQVLAPGKYTFEFIPDLWTIINEAGGVSEYGDLTRVVITRADSRDVQIVNVAQAISTGNAESLPKIRTGDGIEVSRIPGGLQAPSSLSYTPGAKNIFYVTGEVNTPGQFTLESNIDLLDAISIAGGTTENANLRSINVISKIGSGAQVTKFNLKKYVASGAPGRYMINAEDNIVVERKRSGVLGLGSFADIVAVLSGVTTAVLLYTTLAGD